MTVPTCRHTETQYITVYMSTSIHEYIHTPMGLSMNSTSVTPVTQAALNTVSTASVLYYPLHLLP